MNSVFSVQVDCFQLWRWFKNSCCSQYKRESLLSLKDVIFGFFWPLFPDVLLQISQTSFQILSYSNVAFSNCLATDIESTCSCSMKSNSGQSNSNLRVCNILLTLQCIFHGRKFIYSYLYIGNLQFGELMEISGPQFFVNNFHVFP